METEILRLFKGYLGEKVDGIHEEALKFGLLIPNSASDDVVKIAIELYGKDGAKWNETLHKDFEIVRNAPIEDLIAQQLLHYLTTYGFEALGIYNNDLVYVPKEKLEIPELKEDIALITIHPLTTEELSDKLTTLLTSGIALSFQTVKDIMVLSDFIPKDMFDDIKNREVKIALYDKYNITPKNPEEFLRFMLFKLTGETLKIQNTEMITLLKNADKNKTLTMLQSYLSNTPNGYNKLSSIFLRNKNLFLALKTKDNKYKEINTIVNAVRKGAKHHHKPLRKNVLDCLTDRNVNVDYGEIAKELDKVTIFREIRILNGLSYRLFGNTNIVYKIRNGKSYVSTLETNDTLYVNRLLPIYDYVKRHLIHRLSQKISGKIVYIPNNVTYAAPTSEKQFNGNIPFGSYLEAPRDNNLVYGVHWTNIADGEAKQGFYGEVEDLTEERVDLDLKQMNKSDVFGWDASYRSTTSDILFSGDVTNAPLPNGATELFYVSKNYGHGAFLITLNMFTNNSQDVPFEFVIANTNREATRRTNYVLDPNEIVEKVNMTVKKNERQKIVGFITISDSVRFYFNDFSAGSSCSTSSRSPITMGAFDYLQAYSQTQLKLNDLLREAGASVVDTKTVTIYEDATDELGNPIKVPKEVEADIDLSLENITKETIIDMLS